jgi:hypothetical protein
VAKNPKYTYEEVKNLFKKRNYTLISEKFRANIFTRDILEYICNKHKDKGVLKINFNSFLRNHGCKYCGEEKVKILNHNKKKSFDDVVQTFNKYNYIILDDKYINNRTSIKCVCKHHADVIQYKTYSDVQQGYGCRLCSNENLHKKLKLDFNNIQKEFLKKDLVIVQNFYINSGIPIKYICLKHQNIIQEISWDSFKQNHGCKFCGIEKNSGSKHHNWKNGITSLNIYLRKNIEDWKIQSFKINNYKCVISNDYAEVIHHLYPFNKIVKEVLNNVGLPVYSTINGYSREELQILCNECNRLHNIYGFGVALTKDLHNEFHRIYSNKNFSPEDFEQFKTNKLLYIA